MKSSRTGILGGTRACLCKDGTYSIDCCNGSLWAQGIGNVTKEDTTGAYKYKARHCKLNHEIHLHIHESELTIGNVYFITFDNTHHNGCYTILSTETKDGNHVKTVNLYADCTACIAAN